jgi:hypothetical protein
MRDAFGSAGVDISDDAWATATANHLALCGGDASVNIAHYSWLVTAPAEIISEVRGALAVGDEVLPDPTMLVLTPQRQRRLPRRIWVPCTIKASEAQNLLLMP